MQSRSAPTQQVTVAPGTQGAVAGLGALTQKISELLAKTKDAKLRKTQKSAFSKAKKEYGQYRKKAMANLKAENKEIKKRESAKIKKLPTKDRVAARKKLKEALKERTDKLKKQLPGKVSSPGELRNLMGRFRTLKV